MQRIFLGACALSLLTLCVHGNASLAQQKLATEGFGSLSGKVTLVGKVPDIVDLIPKMKDHADRACCLAPTAKPIEKIDQTWLVDPKTKAVANVMIWVKAPKGTYFEIHPKFKVRKDTVILDQPHCAYLPHIAAYNPVYFDGAKEVETGQTLLIKNSSVVPHNVRAIGNPKYNPGFNKNLPPKTEITEKFVPQPLPISLDCGMHLWMAAKLFVFDHPYYAISDDKGNFEIPYVPAGAEVSIMAWHEGVGYVLTNKGTPMTIKAGKNTLDIEVKAPAGN